MVGRGRPPYGRSSHSGTESSNPAPSTGESGANLTSGTSPIEDRLSVVVVILAVRGVGPVEEIVRFVGNQRRLADGRRGAAAGHRGDPTRRLEPLDEGRRRWAGQTAGGVGRFCL